MLTRKVKDTWTTLFIGEMTPRGFAVGAAIGTFLALLPTFGFSALLAIAFMGLFPWVNKPAVFIALAVWNPLVQIPVYALSFEIGSLFYAGEPIVRYNFELLNQFYTFTRRFLFGHVLVTLALTGLAYIVAYLAARAVLR